MIFRALSTIAVAALAIYLGSGKLSGLGPPSV